MNHRDDLEDWAPAPPLFEPVQARLRRLEPLTLTWRGEVHHFEPEARLMFGRRTAILGLLTLWGPTAAGDPLPRRCWMADVYLNGFGFLVGKGATPQAALDALSAELPACAATMVRGGSC